MPCMCGDYCCPSCGPAQGNWRCPICRAWVTEGCIHIDENEEILDEFKAEAQRIDKEEAAFWEEYAESYDERISSNDN